jgi:hypothetical protein
MIEEGSALGLHMEQGADLGSQELKKQRSLRLNDVH